MQIKVLVPLPIVCSGYGEHQQQQAASTMYLHIKWPRPNNTPIPFNPCGAPWNFTSFVGFPRAVSNWDILSAIDSEKVRISFREMLIINAFTIANVLVRLLTIFMISTYKFSDFTLHEMLFKKNLLKSRYIENFDIILFAR